VKQTSKMYRDLQ